MLLKDFLKMLDKDMETVIDIYYKGRWWGCVRTAEAIQRWGRLQVYSFWTDCEYVEDTLGEEAVLNIALEEL